MNMKIEFKIVGVSPLLMHNGQLADPLNPATKALKKAVAKKSKMSDVEIADARRVEFLGGLYLNTNGPCLPSLLIESCILAGAKKYKAGVLAKSGLFCPDQSYDLQYDGPRDPDELAKDNRFYSCMGVKVGQARIMRVRPIFESWAANVAVEIDDQINEDAFRDWAEKAGQLVGLGDYRPKYGRFSVKF